MLAATRADRMRTPVTLAHVLLGGGFPPSSAGNPRPNRMPTFATVPGNDEVAPVLSHLRGSWGNRAAPVPALVVARPREP